MTEALILAAQLTGLIVFTVLLAPLFGCMFDAAKKKDERETVAFFVAGVTTLFLAIFCWVGVFS